MAKTTKSGRAVNPTDAARKQARKKEIARNKMERDLQRATPKDVSEISKRLEELIEEEESEKEKGRPLSKQLHVRRKVLQDAMKLAVAKEREKNTATQDGVTFTVIDLEPATVSSQEDNLKEKFGEEGVRTTPHGHGVPQRSAQDSVYYHPVNNPSGAPPPGRPQRYRDDVDLMDPAKADEAEAALRARMRAQPEAASTSADASAAAGAAGTILPPPDHPPPGMLPPPDGPPPGVAMLPEGVLPPPSDAPPGVILPPPTAPPPGMLAPPLGPPPVPPPGVALPPPVGLPPGMLPPAANLAEMTGAPQVTATKPVETVMEGAATALRTIPAAQDAKLTAMVPAALRAKRHKEKVSSKNVHIVAPGKDRSFGLAPTATRASDAPDSTLDAFMSEIANL